MKHALAIIVLLWAAPALAANCESKPGELPSVEDMKKRPGVLMIDEDTGEAYVVFCDGSVWLWGGEPFGKALTLEMIKRGMVVPASKGTSGKDL